MTAAGKHFRLVVPLAAGLTLAGAAAAAETVRPATGAYASIAAASTLYELADPLPISSLRWSPVASSRIELATGLLPRHELRLAAGLESPSLAVPAWSAEPLRATYRYTFLAQREWSWKVGITTRLGDTADLGRNRFGNRSLLHFAGEGRPAANWRVDLDADRPFTVRGRTLDVGVRVNYLLTPSFSLYGGYRYADHGAEGDDNGPGFSNTANVGLRYRF